MLYLFGATILGWTVQGFSAMLTQLSAISYSWMEFHINDVICTAPNIFSIMNWFQFPIIILPKWPNSDSNMQAELWIWGLSKKFLTRPTNTVNMILAAEVVTHHKLKKSNIMLNATYGNESTNFRECKWWYVVICMSVAIITFT